VPLLTEECRSIRMNCGTPQGVEPQTWRFSNMIALTANERKTKLVVMA
jgi:hypothetical protein